MPSPRCPEQLVDLGVARRVGDAGNHGAGREQGPHRVWRAQVRPVRVDAGAHGERQPLYFSFFSFPQSWLPEPCAFLHASRHRCMSASLMRGLGFLASREGKGGNGLWGSAWYQ